MNEAELRPAVVYARQSRTREGSESLETQVQACTDAAGRLGCAVVETLVEPPSTSGYKERGRNRAKFTELLDGFRAKRWDVVIAYKTDRLSRGGGPGWAPLVDAIETAGLNTDRSVATPSGYVSEFEIGIRASMDREESKKLSDRLTDVAARRAAAGLSNGGNRPFGFEKDGTTLNETEAALYREMAEKVIAGWGIMDVTVWLNEQGHRSTGGKLFDARSVRQMLKRPRYAGIRVHKGAEYPAAWQPIVDEATWERLQLTLRLRGAAHPGRGNGGKAIGLLHGLIYCGLCDTPLNCRTVQGHDYKSRSGKRPTTRVYYCKSAGEAQRQGGCGKVYRNADVLEAFIGELVLFRLDTPELASLLNTGNPGDAELRGLLDQRQALQTRLDGLADDYALGVLNKQQMQRASATAQAELARIDETIAQQQGKLSNLRIPAGLAVRQAWEAAAEPGLQWKRGLLGLLIKRIVVNPSPLKPPPYVEIAGETRRFDVDAVQVEWIA